MELDSFIKKRFIKDDSWKQHESVIKIHLLIKKWAQLENFLNVTKNKLTT